MPDFFDPAGGWPLETFPPKTAEEKTKLQAFFGSTASPKENTTKLFKLGKQLKADGAEFLVAYGFCWGRSIVLVYCCDAWKSSICLCRRKGCYSCWNAAWHTLQRHLEHSPCVSTPGLCDAMPLGLMIVSSMVSAEDAEKLQVPYSFYYTKDEPAEEVRICMHM